MCLQCSRRINSIAKPKNDEIYIRKDGPQHIPDRLKEVIFL